MGFGDGEHSSADTLKKRISIKAKEGNLSGLRELVKRMKSTQRDAFRGKYGNLLNLLEGEVQTSAITALAQYYDPPLRCFTFQDFQLAPKIEELEQILDMCNTGKSNNSYFNSIARHSNTYKCQHIATP